MKNQHFLNALINKSKFNDQLLKSKPEKMIPASRGFQFSATSETSIDVSAQNFLYSFTLKIIKRRINPNPKVSQ